MDIKGSYRVRIMQSMMVKKLIYRFININLRFEGKIQLTYIQGEPLYQNMGPWCRKQGPEGYEMGQQCKMRASISANGKQLKE